MSSEDVDSLRDLLSIILFTVIAAFLALLLWMLLRRHQRLRSELRQSQDVATMSEAKESRRSSMTPTLDAEPTVTSRTRRISVINITAEVPMTPTSDEKPVVTVVRRASVIRMLPEDPTTSPLEGEPVTSGGHRPSVVRISAEVEVSTFSPDQKGPKYAYRKSRRASRRRSCRASKRHSSARREGRSSRGSSRINTPDVASMETSSISSKGSKHKHHRRHSRSAHGSRSTSRQPSLQGSQISSSIENKAAAGNTPSELLPVPAPLVRRPSTESDNSNESNRSTHCVGDEPKVPPAFDTISKENLSMAQSPPAAPVPTVAPDLTDADSKATK